ncbi:unnamed protein product [Ambrosiozyma monospora]|uniref:Unnamed protein product n=1 Tax=Ambrosiozyma monospora TaxID=43982 RepID=A0A9W6TCT5_AMBMO|nr:unnamed protein product [Ambrosiozyma monospora]
MKSNFFESNNKNPAVAKDNIIIDERKIQKKIQIFEIQKRGLHETVKYHALRSSASSKTEEETRDNGRFDNSETDINTKKEKKNEPVKYHRFGFSTSPYTPRCPRRKRKKRPETTGDLTTVEPPSSHWRFFSESRWEVDYNCAKWCAEFGIQDEVDICVYGGEAVAYGATGDVQDGWVYDKDRSYRRRRWTRMVESVH